MGSNGCGMEESDRDRAHELVSVIYSATTTPGAQEDAVKIATPSLLIWKAHWDSIAKI